MANDRDPDFGQYKEGRPGVLKHIDSHIQGRMVAGLVNLLPLLITIAVLLFLIGNADSLVRPLPFISGEPWDFPGIGCGSPGGPDLPRWVDGLGETRHETA